MCDAAVNAQASQAYDMKLIHRDVEWAVVIHRIASDCVLTAAN